MQLDADVAHGFSSGLSGSACGCELRRFFRICPAVLMVDEFILK